MGKNPLGKRVMGTHCHQEAGGAGDGGGVEAYKFCYSLHPKM
jgi:hypothetical protein